MPGTRSNTQRHVVQGGLRLLQSKDDECWTAQLIQAFQGLRKSEVYEQAMQSGVAISMSDFTADSRHRLQGVWKEAGGK